MGPFHTDSTNAATVSTVLRRRAGVVLVTVLLVGCGSNDSGSIQQALVSAGGNEKVGNGSVAVQVDIDQIWNVQLAYNVYFGPQPNGTAAFIKDRDNIALTVKRTF